MTIAKQIKTIKPLSWLMIILLISLIMRLFLLSVVGFKIDVEAWFAWAIRLNEVGLNQFYTSQVWTNYTPGYLYILKLLGLIRVVFSLDNQTFYEILKLPAILADLTLGYLVFKQFKHQAKVGLLAASAILISPAFILNSSVWGQIDSLLTLFIYLGVLFLHNKKPFLAGLLMGLAFLIKPQAIIVLPIVGIVWLTNFQTKTMLKTVITFLLTIFVFSLPFFLPLNQNNLADLFIKMVNDYPYSSLFAYNFWGGLVGFWVSDSTRWLSLTYQQWGTILFAGYLGLVSYYSWKKKLSIWSIASLVSLGFYFLPTRVHERYLYPSLVFLIVTAFESRNKWLFSLVFILSILHFLNLYYVYTYYNYFYFHIAATPYFQPLYSTLDAHSRLLSQLSTLTFVFISYLVIKSKDAQATD